MTRKEKRQKIDQALKEITIPFLRQQGFKGSLPHFRRIKSDRINLLTFQHSFYDTKFVVEIANCPIDGITTYWGKEIKPNKVTTHYLYHRFRLGGEEQNGDHWFNYGETSIFTNIFKRRAKEIIQLWDEAEIWWDKNPFDQKNLK